MEAAVDEAVLATTDGCGGGTGPGVGGLRTAVPSPGPFCGLRSLRLWRMTP